MNTLDRLKIVRGELTQAEFADKLGIHKNTVGRYERGETEPDLSVAAKIYTEFEFLPLWLILGEGPMRLGETQCPVEKLQEQSKNNNETASCARCAEMKTELDEERRERRELSDENRQRAAKIEKLLQENGDLRERCAKFEER